MAARTAAVVAFIGVVAIAAIYLAQRETVMSGHVVAGDMMAELAAKGIATVDRIECDDEIPIDADGARFRCKVRGLDGSTETWEYTMRRDGSMGRRQLTSSRSSRR